VANKSSDIKFRLLGFLPLVFFLAQGLHYWRINQLGHMFWMCNIGNLLLAIGIILNEPILMRVAIIWTVPGLVVWLLYVVMTSGAVLSSTLAHVGGLIVGMIALKKVGMDRRAWLYALAWYFFIQLLSRLLTPPDLNVNLSHRIQPGWEQTFSAYWQFWLALALATALILWALGLMFWRIWPAGYSEPRHFKKVEG
jgi:uncharacterized MnhB-related membrane protein